MMKEDKTFHSASIFWIILVISSFVGLMYLASWAFQNNSIQAIAISFIFTAMILFSIIISKYEIFKQGAWGTSCLAFTIGFFIWIFLGRADQSILSITQNSLFASIASQLPSQIEFILNAIVIPIAEECFWLIGIPFTVMWVMDLIAKNKKTRWAGNFWIQLVFIIAISGVTFAVFHVGKFYLLFLIAAFTFRALLIAATRIDSVLPNFIPVIALVPAFAPGAHIGNNWADTGFFTGVQLLSQTPIGVGILIVLGIIFLSALNQLALYVFKAGKVTSPT